MDRNSRGAGIRSVRVNPCRVGCLRYEMKRDCAAVQLPVLAGPYLVVIWYRQGPFKLRSVRGESSYIVLQGCFIRLFRYEVLQNPTVMQADNPVVIFDVPTLMGDHDNRQVHCAVYLLEQIEHGP